MFSGIIEQKGKVRAFEPVVRAGQVEAATIVVELRLGEANALDSVKLGESIALNGVCLTVTKTEGALVSFVVSSETLARSNLGKLKAGSWVNTERSLRVGDRNSGHWVQGHVDGVGEVVEISGGDASADCYRLKVAFDFDLFKYCAEKGSIAIDGTSLTINYLGLTGANGDGRAMVEIMLIPHTFQNTIASTYVKGSLVNIEVDCLAKYLEKLCQPYLKPLSL